MGDLLRLVSEVRAALAEVVEMSREIKQNLLDSKQLLDEIKKDNEVVGIGVKHNPATDR